MSASLKIGSVRGIGIYLHWTFWLLIVGVFAFFLLIGEAPRTAIEFVGYILVLFGCVVLHELGHALMAAVFEVPTRDITIYPIGGVARLQRIPEESMKEFWIAVAGPAVNLAIATFLAIGISVLGGTLDPAALTAPTEQPVAALMWLNLALVAFNMLPAFPMDGGRVLRSLLATKMAYSRATQIAANIGQGMAILFGIVGLVSFNPILIFIAFFVYLGARQEGRQAMLRAATQNISVREAMMTRFPHLMPHDTLGRAVDELLAGAELDFPIVDEENRVVGLLTRKKLMEALSNFGRDAEIGRVVNEDVLTVEATAMLQEAFMRMQEAEHTSVPVTRHGRLVGLLSLENVGELMMISSALQGRDESLGRQLIQYRD